VVVCTLTGNGLKDPDTAMKVCQQPISLPPVLEEVLKLIEL
jgi:threonine synthase